MASRGRAQASCHESAIIADMESKKEVDPSQIEWCDRPIVRVSGTVMTRDDTLGGWVPYLNGGQSKVGIHESVDGRQYRIYGWRVNDQKITLDCFIQRHMVFHETIGTFHHWKSGDCKMGLTFYTPAEARSFNRGVRVALEQLEKVANYNCSSASSTCSRSSDDHPSTCTSPASSKSSPSSSYNRNTLASSKQQNDQSGKKKLSTSSTSSSSSRHTAKHRKSPSVKQSRPHHLHAVSSSSTSTQSRAMSNNHNGAGTSAPTLSILSASTSPRFCETPSSSDLSQTHFRWPLPQQQPFSTAVSFLNRPVTTDCPSYELSVLGLSSHSVSSTICRDSDTSQTKNTKRTSLSLTEEPAREECILKACESTNLSSHDQMEVPRPHCPLVSPVRTRQEEHSRSRSHRPTKTPYLDILERQRDLKPTEPNSYVLFSSKPAAGVPGHIQSSLAGINPDYKARGYHYHSILSSIHERPYRHPQTGTLSIVASASESRFFNHGDMLHSSNLDTIKDEAAHYEARRSLLSTPTKSKLKEPNYYGDSQSDIERQGRSECVMCCCPFHRVPVGWNWSEGKYKEDLAERSKCRHCHEMFNHERNRPGSCRDAPDKCLKNIEKITCVSCVSSLCYHCCRDDEGDYVDEPCTCSNMGDEGRSRFWRRWSALAALSIFVPCLCLYPPLLACHKCGVMCHCCGGKHQAPLPSRHSDKQSKMK